MLPPTLEVYVLWHPADDPAGGLVDSLLSHFHGNTYAGLLSGAIEVFARSQGWAAPGGPPRTLPLPGRPGAGGVEAAELTALVVLAGPELERAVERAGSGWGELLQDLADAARAQPQALRVFGVRRPGFAADPNGRLNALLGADQALDDGDRRRLCRDLAQALAQWSAGGAVPKRLKVFISHTKHDDSADGRVGRLIDQVRARIDASSRLASFFDSNALQAGENWSTALQGEASENALLALRTDLYASREWCQREMLLAKRAGVPVVVLDALVEGEHRGSFLMDHVARVPMHWRSGADGWDPEAIDAGLARLVDACLHRELWRRQRAAADAAGIAVDWWAPAAPEPATLVGWLRTRGGGADDGELRILHPDPPLGPEERTMLEQIAALGAPGCRLDIVTPRLLAARGF